MTTVVSLESWLAEAGGADTYSILTYDWSPEVSRKYPGNGAQIQQLLEELDRAIKTDLTKRQRQVIRMYWLRGMTQMEIAERLGIPQSSVSITLKRAIARLRKNKKMQKIYSELA